MRTISFIDLNKEHTVPRKVPVPFPPPFPVVPTWRSTVSSLGWGPTRMIQSASIWLVFGIRQHSNNHSYRTMGHTEAGSYNMEWYWFLFSACVTDLLTRKLNIKRDHYQGWLGQSPCWEELRKNPTIILKSPISQQFQFPAPKLF